MAGGKPEVGLPEFYGGRVIRDVPAACRGVGTARHNQARIRSVRWIDPALTCPFLPDSVDRPRERDAGDVTGEIG